MDRAALRALARRNADLMLWAETAVWPDVGVAEPTGPLDLALHARAAALTVMAGAGRGYRRLDEAAWTALLDAAEAAGAEGSIGGAVDTAVSRRITHVTLRLGTRPEGPLTAVFARSEFVTPGSLEEPAWARFLTMCADLSADHADLDALGCWTDLLAAFALRLTAPRLLTAGVMPVEPGRATWGLPLAGRQWYLRLGQSEGTTGLYCLVPHEGGAAVLSVGSGGRDGAEVARLVPARGEAARWRGPTTAVYRGDGRGPVDVIVRDGAMTVRATPGGPGVYLQRA